MKFRLLLFLLPSIFVQQAFAQPNETWVKRYNGPGDNVDEARSIAVDTAGNVYITGSAYNNGAMDIVTISYDPFGQQRWLQAYDGAAADMDEGYQLALSDSGNVYVVGYSKGLAGMQDMITIKYNSAGVQQWVRFYNGAFNNYDAGNAVAVDAAGNVYVTGVETASNYAFDFITVKYGPGGALLWTQSYNGPGNFIDEARDIDLDANGNVYVTGRSDTFYASQPNADIVLLKYSNSGAFQWRRVYDSPGHGYEYSRCLTVDNNNNIYIAGYGFITGNGNDYYILKYNAAGNFQWLRNYNYSGSSFEEPWGIACDSQNNVVVTGGGVTPSAGSNDFVTVKYDPAGVFQWASRYNGPGNGDDKAYGIAIDDSMNIYVTGHSKGTGTLLDMATVKYNPAGTQQFALRYNNATNQDDAGNAIAVRDGDIYVTGKSINYQTADYITIRYSYTLIGLQENSAGVVPLSLYPNPGNNQVTLLVPAAPGGEKSYFIAISNAAGAIVRVAEPVVGESIGTRSALLLNTSGLAAGYYLIQAFEGDKWLGTSSLIVK